ncbi:MAG: 1-(5-phosphoribosyl)-5-[(5-phosphoribosylamino)methylideneamino]imidazole-4-carboxamide isomerase [Bacteroidia bacterium]
MRLIPAIDIIGGKCVRLKKGDYEQKTIYSDNPLEIAMKWEALGGEYLHLVDLDGAKADKPQNLPVVESICKHTRLKVDMGGGIKTERDLRAVLDAGVTQVNIGSLAVKNQPLVADWIRRFGGEKIILSADVKDGYVAIHGWQTLSEWLLTDFIADYQKVGITTVVCTDISRDGMLSGPSFELYQQLMATFAGLRLIASGGIATIDDLIRLRDMNMDGAIIGKALYEGKITWEELIDLKP